jgi:hypothetical protein
MLTETGCRDRVARLLQACAAEKIDLAILSDAKSVFQLSGFLRKPYGWLIPILLVEMLAREYPDIGFADLSGAVRRLSACGGRTIRDNSPACPA